MSQEMTQEQKDMLNTLMKEITLEDIDEKTWKRAVAGRVLTVLPHAVEYVIKIYGPAILQQGNEPQQGFLVYIRNTDQNQYGYVRIHSDAAETLYQTYHQLTENFVHFSVFLERFVEELAMNLFGPEESCKGFSTEKLPVFFKTQ